MMVSELDRRAMLGATAAAGGVLLFGLSGGARAAAARTRIVMHRSPTCGCCLKWAERARSAGFDVTVDPVDDITALKRKLGVPQMLASCHTSEVGGYVLEGHVPLDSVKALLAKKPKVRGLAVPGMPLGAPGMEVPGYAGDAYEVFAFQPDGKFSPFKA